MIQKIIRAMIGIFGFVLGFTIYSSLASTFPVLLFGIKKGTILISAVVGLIIGVIFYIIGPWVIDRFKYIAKLMDKEISKYPQTDILLGSIGLIIGFVIAYLLGGLINSIPIVGGILTFITYGFLGYLGIKIALKSKDDLFNISITALSCVHCINDKSIIFHIKHCQRKTQLATHLIKCIIFYKSHFLICSLHVLE